MKKKKKRNMNAKITLYVEYNHATLSEPFMRLLSLNRWSEVFIGEQKEFVRSRDGGGSWKR